MLRFSVYFFFFKQKTAYEMRISDWSSDVCSSDLVSAGELDERSGEGIPEHVSDHHDGLAVRSGAAHAHALLDGEPVDGRRVGGRQARSRGVAEHFLLGVDGEDRAVRAREPLLDRSEERRVGKEFSKCRSRWSRDL